MDNNKTIKTYDRFSSAFVTVVLIVEHRGEHKTVVLFAVVGHQLRHQAGFAQVHQQLTTQRAQ